MRLRNGSVPIPFRGKFGHAAAVRERAENVIVLAEDEAGRIGLGEGCPRFYITGETVPSALAAIARWRKQGIDRISDKDSLMAWMDRHHADIDANPSAFSAVELALLDLFAQQTGSSLDHFLGLAEGLLDLRTSAVYGLGSEVKFLAQVALYSLNGMREAKLKLSGDPQLDRGRARLLARFGPVRLDANNLWASADAACACLLDGTHRHAWAVEEPIAARDWLGLAQVGLSTRLAIILDESVTRPHDLEALEAGPAYVLNARVSKHGGLLRTLHVIREARARGIKIIVGAQVGETSILARAGLVAARAAGPDLIGFEGAFGTRLLTRDAATPSINFGYRGRVAVAAPDQPGSGLAPTAEVLSACR
jgi:L-alanine-DL-glutamate epimerase-like enolase superfamily enzyme